MGKVKRASFTAQQTETVRRYLDRNITNESLKDKNSLWGQLAIMLFGLNNIRLREQIRSKWYYEQNQVERSIRSTKRSRIGRKLKIPAWMKRKSYVESLKRNKKKPQAKAEKQSYNFEEFRNQLRQMRRGKKKLNTKSESSARNPDEKNNYEKKTMGQNDLYNDETSSEMSTNDKNEETADSESHKSNGFNRTKREGSEEVNDMDNDPEEINESNVDVENVSDTESDKTKSTFMGGPFSDSADISDNINDMEECSDTEFVYDSDKIGEQHTFKESYETKTNVSGQESPDKTAEKGFHKKKFQFDDSSSFNDVSDSETNNLANEFGNIRHEHNEGTNNETSFTKKREEDACNQNKAENVSAHDNLTETEHKKFSRKRFEFPEFSSNSEASEIGKDFQSEDSEWKPYNPEDVKVNDEVSQSDSETKVMNSSDEESQTVSTDQEYFQTIKAMKNFDISFSPDEWKSIQPLAQKPKKLAPGWTDMFSEKFNKVIPSCVLKFGYQNIIPVSKKDGAYFGGKAECKHKNCGQFKFIIKRKPQPEEDVKVNVVTIRTVIRHTKGDIKKRQLKGRKRRKAQDEMKTQTPASLHNTQFGEMAEEEILAGNFTKCQSEFVYRKAKSDWIVHDVLHKDPFTELIITQANLQNEDEESNVLKGYIQEISYCPFMAVMFKEMSLEVAKFKIKHGDGVFHLDATGSIAKKISEKRLLYYALVVKSSGGISRSVPVLEFFTDHHGTYYIVRPLLTFFSSLGNLYRPVRIETDFSWALIHSALLSTNSMDIHTYLRICFSFVHGQREKNFTTVHLCATHMLKTVRDTVKDLTKDKSMRELTLRLFALMQNTVTIEEAVALWRIWCVVFLSKELTGSVNEAIAEMNKAISCASIEEIIQIDDSLLCDEKFEEDEDAIPASGPIRAQSPFNAFFKQFVTDATEQELGNEEENPYYLPQVIEIVMKNYMPLIPLWSGFMLEGEGDDKKKRDNNAPVEAWMHSVKDSILQKKRNMRVGKLVGLIHRDLKGRLRKHLMIKKTKKATNMKRKKSQGKEEPETAQEGWNKRGTTSKQPKNVFYSPPKKIPTPKPKKRERQNIKKDSKHRTHRTKSSDENLSSEQSGEDVYRKADENGGAKDETGHGKPTCEKSKKENLKTKFKKHQPKKRGKPFEEENLHKKRVPPRMKKDKSDQVVPGLVNRNNTCWLNSSLQALAVLPDFYLQGQNELSASAQEAITMIRTGSKKTHPINLIDFRNVVESEVSSLPLGEQHDAADFINMLLTKNHPEDTGYEAVVEYIQQCMTCQKRKSKDENVRIISAEIPPYQKSVSVKDCLSEYSKEEVLTVKDNPVYCSRCDRNANHTIMTKISKLDNGMILQLKRYRFGKTGLRKDQSVVKINRLLAPDGANVYRLYAVLIRRAIIKAWMGLNTVKIPFPNIELAPLGHLKIDRLYCDHLSAFNFDGIFFILSDITVTVDDSWTIRRCDDIDVQVQDRRYLESIEVMRNSYILFYRKMEMKCVTDLIRNLDSGYPIKECGNITLYSKDLLSLRNGEWVNDQIVNAYLTMTSQASDTINVMDVFFYLNLENKKSTAKWMKEDTFSKDKVLVPVVHHNHWSLVVIDIINQSVKVYDSGNNKNEAGEILRQFAMGAGVLKKEASLHIVKGLPKQTNTVDCGVFMCQFAACVGLNRDFSFTQNDMQDIRQKMQVECLIGKLL